MIDKTFWTYSIAFVPGVQGPEVQDGPPRQQALLLRLLREASRPLWNSQGGELAPVLHSYSYFRNKTESLIDMMLEVSWTHEKN